MKKITYQWPSSGMGSTLVSDHAELKIYPSSVLSAALNLELENAKPYDGVAKGVVENSFRFLQAKFRTFIPGHVHRDSGKRDGPVYRLDAALEVEDLRK